MNNFIVSEYGVYEHNVGILKRYAPDNFKLINLRAVRKAGYEAIEGDTHGKKNTAGNTAKLEESLSRSKSKVYELAMCNPWEYFITLTLNEEYINRYDLNGAFSKVSKWINNLNYQRTLNIKYLLIPEPHKDGAWHFHGLLMNMPPSLLVPFRETDNIPHRLKRLLSSAHEIFNWPMYQAKFGWVTVELIRDKERVAKYITKYITKQLIDSRIELNHHVYYASKGLKRAEVIYRAELRQVFEADYENDYVRVKQFDNIEEPLQFFCDKE